MAKKLASGSSKNKKDSAGRRLGFKIFPGQLVKEGAIILRQRGTVWHSGKNTTLGRDHTINANISGFVKKIKIFNKKFLEVESSFVK